MNIKLHPALNLLLAIAIFFIVIKSCNSCAAKEYAEMEELKFSNYPEWRHRKVMALVDPDGSIDEVEYAVQKLLKDPSSYEHISTQFDPVGDSFKIVTRFSGKNSFGAVVPHVAEATIDIEGNVLEIKLLD